MEKALSVNQVNENPFLVFILLSLLRRFPEYFLAG